MTEQEIKIEKLMKLLSVLDESLTKKDFISAFENIIGVIKQIQSQNEREISAMQQTVKLLSNKITEDTTNELKNAQSTLRALVDSTANNTQQILSTIMDRFEKLKSSVKNGQTPIKGVDYQDGEKGNDGSPDSPAEIVNKLESLLGDERLDKSAIKGLDDAIKRLSDKFDSARPIFGPGKTKLFLIDLSNLLDGTTKSFALPTNFGIVNVASSSTPFAWRPLIDYQSVGNRIVFATAVDAPSMLAAGQTLIVTIIK